MELNAFTFIMRSPDGQEYEMAVPARKEADAERLLKNLLDALNSRDKIVALKDPQISDPSSRFSDAGSCSNPAVNWADKNVIYKNKERNW